MRREPQIPWSSGQAAIHFGPTDCEVPIFFESEEAYRAEWARVSAWKYEVGCRAIQHTLRLERHPHGNPWLDFGVRYVRADGTHLESQERRLAFLCMVGGNSRPKVVKRLRLVTEIWVYAVIINADLTWQKAFERLGQGQLAAWSFGTKVELKGLEAFGKWFECRGKAYYAHAAEMT